METNVLNKLTYGLYILSSKKGDKANGCIIDACVQVGVDPDRVLISVMNSNYTRKLIKDSKVFCIAVLDEDCPFELIKHFGYQSGKDIDKFNGMTTFDDINDVPCILTHTCAAISARVVESINIGSHTIFIGKVMDMKHLSNKNPMTYAYYQQHVMPKTDKPDETKGDRPIIGWKCTVCGSIYSDAELPNDYTCSVCGHPAGDFVPMYEL